MSDASQGKNLRPELRIFIASALSIIVILLWAKFFAPKPPQQPPQANKPPISAPATAGTQANGNTPSSAPSTNTTSPSTVSAMPPAEVRGDSQERTIVVESDFYRVEFSNRGGVVKSWKLKKYMDDAKPRQMLDLVHAKTAQEVGGWPFAVTLDDAGLENTANSALYVSSASDNLTAPADVSFSWSDGHLEIKKRFHFDQSYVAKVEVVAKYDGKPITAGLAWLGGFGDLTVTNPRPIETVNIFYSEDGKLNALPYKKVEDWDKVGNGVWWGGKDWTGIEDRYFATVFLPETGTAPGKLETRYWKVWHPVQIDGKDVPEPVPQVSTATTPQTSLRVYVGPKDYDVLKKMTPPLHSLVNFGWLEIIADPLFHGMKWLQQKGISNWGWAIVVMTLVINMLLFPLRISSYKTTLKMQRVAPEIKAINERYKKYSMRDPRKAEMNKEVMAVYSREGINPVGGCFQMLVQMPIWIGLNTALRNAIELRHAPWFGWITDLSSKDPYYILPVIMAVSMYLATKMTPMTTTDPQQQAMMKFMPLSFAGMFIIFPISSGLAVYILTSSLVGIAQQWYLNRTHPINPTLKPVKAKKA
ncbi:MAG TPA: membrane protein insertase YidC [Candidatus Dormibacteraeota bacterium]|nr:membrane protein insertase YidC [Candidatus Dormibacteraeota bacterium]